MGDRLALSYANGAYPSRFALMDGHIGFSHFLLPAAALEKSVALPCAKTH